MGAANYDHQTTTNQANPVLVKNLITWALYLLVSLGLLHLYLIPPSLPQDQLNHLPRPKDTPTSTFQGKESVQETRSQSHNHSLLHRPSPPCNYFDGRWVPDARGPRYNGTSCATVKDGQNCMAHGRPDVGYLHWRWQPKQCQLPPFDPLGFLRLIMNKHVAFVGDSMARNQLESLLCLLATASSPELVYRDGEDNKFRRWVFRGHNATVSVFWSPFLVKGVEKSAATGLHHNELHLDSPNERWASELDKMDIVVFSAGHWFLHPAVYYENDVILGSHDCPELNHTEIGFFEVFRKVFRTTLSEVSRRQASLPPGSSTKLVVVTTFSPAHFDGEWDKAGACPKKEPYKEGEKELNYMDAELRKGQMEEVATAAEEAAAKGGARMRLEALDITRLALMRPDGHPGPYMYADPFAGGLKERMQNDCVHWCLPGPIDAWNEILLQVMRRTWNDEKNRS